MKVGVLHNIDSGINKKKGFADVRQVFSGHADVRQIEVRSLTGIRQGLYTFMQSGVDLILINGGDGTLQAVLSCLFNDNVDVSLPMLAVLPSGTTNMSAGDIGLRGNRRRAVQRLLVAIQSGNLDSMRVVRTVLRVHAGQGEQAIYGMFFGAAGIYAGIDYCRERIHTLGLRGELGPGVAMLNVIGSFVFGSNTILKSTRIGMQINDGVTREQDLILVYATTLERLFLGLRPYISTSRAPIYFTAIRSGTKHMLRILPSFIRGKQHKLFTPANGFESHNILRLVLYFEGGFTLDGELYNADSQSGPVTIEYGGDVTFVRA